MKDLIVFIVCCLLAMSSLLVSFFERTTHLQQIAWDLSYISVVSLLFLWLMITRKGWVQYIWLLGFVLSAMNVVNLFMHDLKLELWHAGILYIAALGITLIIRKYAKHERLG